MGDDDEYVGEQLGSRYRSNSDGDGPTDSNFMVEALKILTCCAGETGWKWRLAQLVPLRDNCPDFNFTGDEIITVFTGGKGYKWYGNYKGARNVKIITTVVVEALEWHHFFRKRRAALKSVVDANLMRRASVVVAEIEQVCVLLCCVSLCCFLVVLLLLSLFFSLSHFAHSCSLL